MMQMIQDDTDLSDESDYRKSIFNLFNHLQSKRNKNQQNSFKIHNQKTENSNFLMIARRWCRWYRSSRSEGYRHRHQTDRRLTSSIFGDHSTQKALKGNNRAPNAETLILVDGYRNLSHHTSRFPVISCRMMILQS